MDRKIRVLGWHDMLGATGFSQVAHNVLKHLYATGKYEFDIIGINHDGNCYDHNKFPYNVYPAVSPLSSNEKARSDVYGFQKFLMFAGSGKYDLIFIINDPFIMNVIYPQLLATQQKMPKDKKFEIIIYHPVDSPLKPEWVKNVISPTSFPVTYTKYAMNECLKHDPSLAKKLIYIYHGIDKGVFYPIEPEKLPEIKKQFLGPKHYDKYLVLNLNRNQPRKDLHKTFAAFKLFHDKYPNTVLWIHAQAEDVGGNLIEIAKAYGLEWDKDWICPAPGTFGANQGWPVETINKLYNISDMVVSTTLGEGFGLSIVEAFATMTPAIFPNNTSLTELMGENESRGWLVKSGSDLNHFVCLGPGDNSQVRPTVDVYDMADKMEYVYLHPEEAKVKAERAYNEVWEWKNICEQWKEIFDKAWNKVQVMRSEHKDIGRNDLCPCGSQIKYKLCCGK